MVHGKLKAIPTTAHLTHVPATLRAPRIQRVDTAGRIPQRAPRCPRRQVLDPNPTPTRMNWTPRVAWTNAHNKDGACRAAKSMWIDGVVYAEVWKGRRWDRRDADGKSDLGGRIRRITKAALASMLIWHFAWPRVERNPPIIGTRAPGKRCLDTTGDEGGNAEDVMCGRPLMTSEGLYRDRMEIYGEAADESKSREQLDHWQGAEAGEPNAARHDVRNP
ncbi:hypothetical protein FB45DRAFT_860909 [Roridomyces roridus]|uniref:Uncharacterized protein n=1 Tax=Roridomyces roridus TaxID=1738132 RepID=A0AAD7CIA4_9AGAR|nr:hypothetical protein FB45DRAFT_860909 [Roridomyces roridus]